MRLLRAHIDSVEKLDLLLALGRALGQSATLPVLARLARLPDGVTRRLAGELEAAGLIAIVANREARLTPSRDSDRTAVAELLHHEALDRNAILDALMGARSP
jgi:hypothetical protein